LHAQELILVMRKVGCEYGEDGMEWDGMVGKEHFG
jgi:hypothetical protein